MPGDRRTKLEWRSVKELQTSDFALHTSDDRLPIRSTSTLLIERLWVRVPPAWLIAERAVAQTDRALRLWSTLRRSRFTTTRSSRLPSWSTWLITRMLWVRVPPAQLQCTSRCSSMVERRYVSDSPLRRVFVNVGRQGRSQCELSLGCPQPAPVGRWNLAETTSLSLITDVGRSFTRESRPTR